MDPLVCVCVCVCVCVLCVCARFQKDTNTRAAVNGVWNGVVRPE